MKVVRSLLRAQQLAKEVSEPLLNLTSSIILANFSTLRRDIHTKDLITNIYHFHPSKTTSFPLEDLLAFGKSLLQWEYFKDDVLPHVLGLCQARLYEGVKGDERKEVVLMLVEVILAGCVDSDYGADITPKKGLFIVSVLFVLFIISFIRCDSLFKKCKMDTCKVQLFVPM